MDASEYALHEAASSTRPRRSRIARTVVNEPHNYREWELRHANLLLPVASEKANKSQQRALRSTSIQIVHQTAFFRYLQAKPPNEKKRQQLFRLLHATKDLKPAMLFEHRQYMLAYSSRVSADHIVDVMQDELGSRYLQQYEEAYARCFEIKCFLATASTTGIMRELVYETYREARGNLLKLRRLLETEFSSESRHSFEKLELLSRSGRYKALDYLFH